MTSIFSRPIATCLCRLQDASAPRPLRRCRRCNISRAFVSSGQFRVNANGRRVDIWLIYRCDQCGATWNRPVLKRVPVAAIDPAALLRFQNNDPSLAASIAADANGLRALGLNIQTQTSRPHWTWEPAQGGVDPPWDTWFAIEHAGHCGVRLDTLIAMLFDLSRGQVRALALAGRLHCYPGGLKRSLKRPPVSGCLIRIQRPVDKS